MTADRPTAVRCPACGQGFLDAQVHDEAGMCACACGHRAFAGFVAEAAAVRARESWLADRIADGTPSPDPLLARAYRIWPAPGPADRGWAGPGAPGRRGAPGVQTLLLGLGAATLVVAASVFAAVVWDRIGAAGQVAVMALGTVGVSALAVALRPRLRGTAEALAVVATGLLLVDVIAAPALGLLPPEWLDPPSAYPPLALAAVGVLLLVLAHRVGLSAWAWAGWAALPLAAGLVVAITAGGPDAPPARTAGAVAVPALVSVAILAASRRADPRWGPLPMQVSAGVGLVASALVTAGAAAERDALPGALLTTALTTLAVAAWAWRDRRPWLRAAAVALVGATGGVALLLPAEPQPAWLGVVVAAAGFALGVAVAWFDDGRSLPVLAAASLWLAWSGARVMGAAQTVGDQAVVDQLAALSAAVAVLGFALVAWLPWAPWVGAGLAQFALLVWGSGQFEVVEAATLPFAALLLAAGLLWRRFSAPGEAGPGQTRPPSLLWLGPAATVALVPSALATWEAPWVLGASGAEPGPALVRLICVLAVSVAAVVAGARWGLAGLLLPGVAALVLAVGGQAWTGLVALPRWVALGIAGVVLVGAGARIEWLRGQGGRARRWLHGLR